MSVMLQQLPQHILTNIFKLLCLQDIHNLILTCKALCTIITNDNVLWRSIALSRLIIQTKGNNGFQRQTWYNQCRTSYNWCHAFFKKKIILHHRVNYMPWIKLHNSEQLFITVGEKIHCFAVNGFPNCSKPLWTVEAPPIVKHDIRTNDISRFILNENILVCGNRDGSTAVYNVDNRKCQSQLMYQICDCHQHGDVEVSAVEIVRSYEDFYIVTASNNSSDIQFWHQNVDRETRDFYYDHHYKSYKQIFLDENIGVKCLAVNENANKLAVGPNGNNKPVVIDTLTGQILITNDDTQNRKRAVRDLQWHNENTVVYVTHSGQLQILDVRNNAVVYAARDPFQSTLYCVKSDGQRALVTGSSEYSRCVLYDWRSPKYVQVSLNSGKAETYGSRIAKEYALKTKKRQYLMYFTQKRSSPVYSLDFNNSTLLAAVDRGVAALNFDVLLYTSRQLDYSNF